MSADVIWKQGDTGPVFKEAFTKSSGGRYSLEGATVTLTLRAFTAASPMTLTGTLAVTDALEGEATYTPSAQDTAIPGDYAATWTVVFPGGSKLTFPTVGYLWVRVEENLTTTGGQQLVGLPVIKDYLDLPANDRVHDEKLLKVLAGVRPLIENITGPIIPQVFDEWYEGGHSTISLRHNPNYGYGTSPLLRLLAVSEYRGPIEYNLAIISTPTQGSVYSCMLNAEVGTITRHTSGGGTEHFWHDPEHGGQSVHIVYEAGQERTPDNVEQAVLEAVRVNYMTSQAVGRGRETVVDEQEPTVSLGFFLPRRCHELLAPTAKAPAVA
jgi:hypothetical protein